MVEYLWVFLHVGFLFSAVRRVKWSRRVPSEACDTIRVADGTYTPTSGTDRTATFTLETGVSILGGYAGGAVNPDARDIALYPTLLSGEIGNLMQDIDNSYHVVTGSGTDGTTILDGVTITDGYNNAGANPISSRGAGMYNIAGSPTLRSCTFSGNTVFESGFEFSYGGGMYNGSSSSPTLVNCTFSGNRASAIGDFSGFGGGMYNDHSSPTLTNCTFSGNTASGVNFYGYGGGMANENSSSPTLSKCTFNGNTAQGGGGMSNSYSSSPTLTNCMFSGNAAVPGFNNGTGGGGAMNNFSGSSPRLFSCTFNGNSVTGFVARGGGMHSENNSSATLTNCTFSRNTAGTSGGAIDQGSGTLTLINCTLSANSASSSGGGMRLSSSTSAVLSNSIVWDNTTSTPGSPQIVVLGSQPIITYSDVAGVGVWPGLGNINQPPLFRRNPSGSDFGDLRLQATSPCIDAGNKPAVPSGIFTDMDGHNRFVNIPTMPDTGVGTPPVDMGAYERQAIHIIYVDKDSTAAVHDGGNWPKAFLTLQEGLTAALPGDQIHVADGIYTPTATLARTISFPLKNGVTVKGSYRGDGTYSNVRNFSSTPSILSGDIGTVGNISDNSYHVVVGNGTDATAVLDGFRITGGNANGSGIDQEGGGMFNASSSPTLTNCTFTGNAAFVEGGGMYNGQSSSPKLTNCTFSLNSTIILGGGMYNAPGASPTLINCIFNGNSAFNGGGMVNYGASPTLINCTFSRNSAGHAAGGMLDAANSSPMLINCTFSGNTAGTRGGGMVIENSSSTITNCILWFNIAPTFPQIDVVSGNGTAIITYSDVEGGWSGTGNINMPPMFVRNPIGSDYGNLRLQATSPCIDVGSNAAATHPKDQDNNTRIVNIPFVNDPGAIVDMGAFERQLPLRIESGNLLRNLPGFATTFSSQVDTGGLTADDVLIRPSGRSGSVGAVDVSYDPDTRTATFGLPTTLADGDYTATLLAGSVTDTAGDPLAADFSFDFFFLAGDANHDRTVNLVDFNILAVNFGEEPRTFSEGDFNYDGRVNLADYNILAGRFGTVLSPDGLMRTSGERLGGLPSATRFGDRSIATATASLSDETEDDVSGLS